MTAADLLHLAFDAVIALALPALAWRVLRSDELREAVVLFIAFGLLAALAWARLDAPDIAMVEAAVGAGLTGVLLMSALGWMRRTEVAPGPGWGPASAGVPLAVAAAFGWAAAALLEPRTTLRTLVLDRLDQSGADHPVTAVLLSFRGYDTLLEVTVLVAVAIGVEALFPWRPSPMHEPEHAGPLLSPLVHGLLPLFVLTAGYLVWKGSHGPGGAFQAGALLAGGGVLLLLARPSWPPARLSRVLPKTLALGPGFFLSVGGGLLFAGYGLLEYPHSLAKPLIVAIETTLMVSITMALWMFFPRPLSSRTDDQ